MNEWKRKSILAAKKTKNDEDKERSDAMWSYRSIVLRTGFPSLILSERRSCLFFYRTNSMLTVTRSIKSNGYWISKPLFKN